MTTDNVEINSNRPGGDIKDKLDVKLKTRATMVAASLERHLETHRQESQQLQVLWTQLNQNIVLEGRETYEIMKNTESSESSESFEVKVRPGSNKAILYDPPPEYVELWNRLHQLTETIQLTDIVIQRPESVLTASHRPQVEQPQSIEEEKESITTRLQARLDKTYDPLAKTLETVDPLEIQTQLISLRLNIQMPDGTSYKLDTDIVTDTTPPKPTITKQDDNTDFSLEAPDGYLERVRALSALLDEQQLLKVNTILIKLNSTKFSFDEKERLHPGVFFDDDDLSQIPQDTGTSSHTTGTGTIAGLESPTVVDLNPGDQAGGQEDISSQQTTSIAGNGALGLERPDGLAENSLPPSTTPCAPEIGDNVGRTKPEQSGLPLGKPSESSNHSTASFSGKEAQAEIKPLDVLRKIHKATRGYLDWMDKNKLISFTDNKTTNNILRTHIFHGAIGYDRVKALQNMIEPYLQPSSPELNEVNFKAIKDAYLTAFNSSRHNNNSFRKYAADLRTGQKIKTGLEVAH